MTSHDEQAFMTAILAAPDDDTPRLVFADWLDERGTDDDKARAALIRAQCRLEHLPAGRERRELEREAKAVLKSHAARWVQPLKAVRFGTEHVFRRGFLDGLTISSTEFVSRGKELFALVPTLRSVRFPNAANELIELADSPFLARLASADLARMCSCGYCGIDSELRDLFKSKHAKGLKNLNIARDRIDAAGAMALARSTVLANLVSLDLSSNPLGPAGAAALGASRHLTNLGTLNLAHSNIQSGGLQAMAATMTPKRFPALRRLNLCDNAIGATGVKALVAASFFNQLTMLDLSQNRIAEAGAKALAGTAGASKLEVLDVRGCRLGQKATELLKAAFGKRVKIG